VALTPYKQILTMTKEAIQAALAPVRSFEMKRKAELEMASIDSGMLEMDQKIQEVCSKYPINFNSLIDAIDEKALLERRRKQFEQIIAEMFPEK
jgi:hypothetical protein